MQQLMDELDLPPDRANLFEAQVLVPVALKVRVSGKRESQRMCALFHDLVPWVLGRPLYQVGLLTELADFQARSQAISCASLLLSS